MYALIKNTALIYFNYTQKLFSKAIHQLYTWESYFEITLKILRYLCNMKSNTKVIIILYICYLSSTTGTSYI